jgi:hypothetical protein
MHHVHCWYHRVRSVKDTIGIHKILSLSYAFQHPHIYSSTIYYLYRMLSSVATYHCRLPGVVTHRDVLHAYAILALWIIMHHQCRAATSWGSSCEWWVSERLGGWVVIG